MGVPGQACPRCGAALSRSELRSVGIDVCTQCKGMLVSQGVLVRLLDAMSVDLLTVFNPDNPIKPIKDAGGVVSCPKCRKPMQNDNYCGAGVVFFDRCEACGLLWLDPEELGAMTLMWAKMESRRAHDQSVYAQNLSPFARPAGYPERTLGDFVSMIVGGGLLRL
jgi:Zn-finger nucleic acid-binding protein